MSNIVNTRRKYTKEFKLKVVREYLGGQTLSQLSRLYGISTSTLGTWFTLFKEEVENEAKAEVFEAKELEAKVEFEEIKEEVVNEKGELEAEIERLNKLIDQQQNVIDMLKSQLNTFGEKDKEILEVATTLLGLVYNR